MTINRINMIMWLCTINLTDRFSIVSLIYSVIVNVYRIVCITLKRAICYPGKPDVAWAIDTSKYVVGYTSRPADVVARSLSFLDQLSLAICFSQVTVVNCCYGSSRCCDSVSRSEKPLLAGDTPSSSLRIAFRTCWETIKRNGENLKYNILIRN